MDFYDSLEELGYLPKDLYEMDMNELEGVLINRRKGIAKESYMIGMLSRTAFAQDVPDSPEKAFPGMYPKPKSYKMPDFLKEKYYRENGGGIDER